jgi:hypothetical protein
MKQAMLDDLLIDLYDRQHVPLDKLPYSPEFDAIVEEANRRVEGVTERIVWLSLMRLRKQMRLRRKVRKTIADAAKSEGIDGFGF